MRLKVLSLGAGVQSSTLLLMACAGEIEKPDCAIFADTQWEPKAVYAWLEVLRREAEAAGIPVYTVTAGNIKQDALAGIVPPSSGGKAPRRFASMPFFTRDERGRISMLRRQCTNEYKIRPIRRRIREELERRGIPKRPGAVELWMGVSTDEMSRMRLSDVRYIVNRYPLIERQMDRTACVRWLVDHGYPRPPKSSCIGCPFHDDRYWRALREQSPEEWAEAVEFDEAIRRMARINDEVYVYRRAIPLREARLELPTDGMEPLFDGMADECYGMCGL